MWICVMSFLERSLFGREMTGVIIAYLFTVGLNIWGDFVDLKHEPMIKAQFWCLRIAPLTPVRLKTIRFVLDDYAKCYIIVYRLKL